MGSAANKRPLEPAVITLEDDGDSDDELVLLGAEVEEEERRVNNVASEIVTLSSSEDEDEAEEDEEIQIMYEVPRPRREVNRRHPSGEEASPVIAEVACSGRRSEPPPMSEVIQLFDSDSDSLNDLGDSISGNLVEEAETAEDIQKNSVTEEEGGELGSPATDDDEVSSVSSISSGSSSRSSLSTWSSLSSSSSTVQDNLEEDDSFPGDGDDEVEISTISVSSSATRPSRNNFDDDSITAESDNDVTASTTDLGITFNADAALTSGNEDEDMCGDADGRSTVTPSPISSSEADPTTSVEDPTVTFDEDVDISINDPWTCLSELEPLSSPNFHILQLPVDPVRETRIVYYPKLDFSMIRKEEKRIILNQLTKRANLMIRFGKFGSKYKPEFPKLPAPKSKLGVSLPRNILKEDGDGIIRRIFFRHTRHRAEDTAAVAAGVTNFKLPQNPTPSYLELISACLPPGTVPDRLFLSRRPPRAFTCGNQLLETLRNVGRTGSLPSNQTGEKDPRTDPQPSTSAGGKAGDTSGPTSKTDHEIASDLAREDLSNGRFVRFGLYINLSEEKKDEIMKMNGQLIVKALADVLKKQKEEEEAKRQAKLKRKAAAARRAELEACDRKRTRLSSGVIPRPDYSILRAVNLFPVAEATAPKSGGGRQSPALAPGGEVGTITPSSKRTQKIAARLPPPPASHNSDTSLLLPPPLKKHKRIKSTTFNTRRSNTSGLKKGSAAPSPSSTLAKQQANRNPATNPQRERCPLENDAGWVDGNNWEVEKIIDVNVENNDRGEPRRKYRVKWKGWEKKYNSWIDEDDFNGTQPALKIFWRRHAKMMKELNLEIVKLAAQVEPEPSDFYFIDF